MFSKYQLIQLALVILFFVSADAGRGRSKSKSSGTARSRSQARSRSRAPLDFSNRWSFMVDAEEKSKKCGMHDCDKNISRSSRSCRSCGIWYCKNHCASGKRNVFLSKRDQRNNTGKAKKHSTCEKCYNVFENMKQYKLTDDFVRFIKDKGQIKLGEKFATEEAKRVGNEKEITTKIKQLEQELVQSKQELVAVLSDAKKVARVHEKESERIAKMKDEIVIAENKTTYFDFMNTIYYAIKGDQKVTRNEVSSPDDWKSLIKKKVDCRRSAIQTTINKYDKTLETIRIDTLMNGLSD